jgi:hypothetical protein
MRSLTVSSALATKLLYAFSGVSRIGSVLFKILLDMRIDYPHYVGQLMARKNAIWNQQLFEQ